MNPKTLEELAKAIQDLRENVLFNEEIAVQDPIAEQHYLAALASLETAQRHVSIANFTEARALAVSQLGYHR